MQNSENSGSVLLNLSYARKSSGGPGKMQILIREVWEGGLRACTSNRLPGDAPTAGLLKGKGRSLASGDRYGRGGAAQLVVVSAEEGGVRGEGGKDEIWGQGSLLWMKDQTRLSYLPSKCFHSSLCFCCSFAPEGLPSASHSPKDWNLLPPSSLQTFTELPLCAQHQAQLLTHNKHCMTHHPK